tara:strand:+ start:1347 stop:2711 length:1365 start_codon:yes stop_codon:yes gene_type:complete
MPDFNLQPRVMPTDTYDKPDAYELMSLYLESESGGKVDIKPLFQNISFVEDMSKCAMSGSILIKDAVNLLSTFPISGYEKLHIQFRTPGIDSDYIRKVFDVVEVTDKVKAPNDRAEVYRIKFVSPAATINKGTKISKSFTGKISEIAKEIYSDFIGGELETQDTANEQRYVIPRWSPFKTIEWLAARAIPAQRSSETNYFFFETMSGHKFISLSELASQEPVMSYFSVPTGVRDTSGKGGGGRNFGRDFSNVKAVRFLKANQKLKEFMEGAFSSVLYTHDVTTKQWGRQVYNYNDDSDVRNVSKEKVTKNQDKFVSKPDVSFNLVTKQTGLMGADHPDVQNHEDWLQRHISTQSLIDTVKVRVSVSGNSLLEAGDVVELYVPKSAAIKATDGVWYDEQFSGKYLITTIRHTIDQEGYTSTILLSKNGYEKPLADKSTFMGTSSNDTQSNLIGKR